MCIINKLTFSQFSVVGSLNSVKSSAFVAD